MFNFLKDYKLNIKKLTFIWFYYHISLLVLYFFVYNNKVAPLGTSLLDYIYLLYDDKYYIDIANQGYLTDNIMVFFPLIPLLIKILTPVGMIILNHFLSYFVLILLYYFMVDSKYTYAEEIAILFAISPINIYCNVCYTEFVLLFLGLLSLILYKKHKYPIFLGFTLGLCVTSRLFGITYLIAFCIIDLWKYIRYKKLDIKYSVIYIFLSCLIGCIYPIYVAIRTNNIFGLLTLEELYWKRVHTNFFSYFIKGFKYLLIVVYDKPIIFYVDFFFILLLISLSTCLCFRHIICKKDKFVAIQFLTSLFLITSTIITFNKTSPFGGSLRYILSTVSLYLLLDTLKNRKCFVFIRFMSIFITIFTGYCFYNGWYFF